LRQAKTPELTLETIKVLMDEANDEKALDLLHHCQKIGWVQGIDKEIQCPEGALEDILENLLDSITEKGKVLLVMTKVFIWFVTVFLMKLLKNYLH
jgi:hypothetical protein